MEPNPPGFLKRLEDHQQVKRPNNAKQSSFKNLYQHVQDSGSDSEGEDEVQDHVPGESQQDQTKAKAPPPMPSSQFAKPPPSFSAGSKDDFVPKFGQKGKKAGPPAGKGPLPWDSYFDRKDTIDGKIPIFWAGNSGHIFICLHGAGHSALTFSCLAKELKDQY